MKLIDTGTMVWRQKVYVQSTGDEELDLRNRRAVRDGMCHQTSSLLVDSPDGPHGPLKYVEVPEPEWTNGVHKGSGEETISQRVTRAFSHYALRGALGTNTSNFLEVIVTAIADLDARTY